MTTGDEHGTDCPHCESAINMSLYHDHYEGRQFYCPGCRDLVVIDAMVTTFTLARLDEYKQLPAQPEDTTNAHSA